MTFPSPNRGSSNSLHWAWPGRKGERVRQAKARGPAADDPVVAAYKDPAPLPSDMERCALEAVAALGGRVSGQQIADKAGYPFDSAIRTCLAALRRRGILGGRPGEGYTMTDAAAALLGAGAPKRDHHKGERTDAELDALAARAAAGLPLFPPRNGLPREPAVSD